MNGMATFGWCSTEKPASFTWPSHVWDRVSSFGFVLFYHSEVIPLATVSVRVPFLFPLLPVCFSALLPTYIQLPEEQVACAVLRFMSRLSSSFLMLCNKLLLSNLFVMALVWSLILNIQECFHCIILQLKKTVLQWGNGINYNYLFWHYSRGIWNPQSLLLTRNWCNTWPCSLLIQAYLLFCVVQVQTLLISQQRKMQ